MCESSDFDLASAVFSTCALFFFLFFSFFKLLRCFFVLSRFPSPQSSSQLSSVSIRNKKYGRQPVEAKVDGTRAVLCAGGWEQWSSFFTIIVLTVGIEDLKCSCEVIESAKKKNLIWSVGVWDDSDVGLPHIDVYLDVCEKCRALEY